MPFDLEQFLGGSHRVGREQGAVLEADIILGGTQVVELNNHAI